VTAQVDRGGSVVDLVRQDGQFVVNSLSKGANAAAGGVAEMVIDRRAFSIAAPHTWNSACKCSIIRPHRSTTYEDAAYCYRPSSVVCLSVCLSHY